MQDFDYLDLKDIMVPVSEIAIQVINKLASALSWSFSPKGIKRYILEANKSIISEIANREDINPLERAAIISNYGQIVKEYKNQRDIVNVALKNLSKEAQPNLVHDDWLEFFFERAKIVSDEKLKLIWGQLLAGEFNNPNTYTKQLVHVLSIMDQSLAMKFMKFRNSCFGVPVNFQSFVYYSNHNNINNAKRYKEKKIDFVGLRELDNAGIIKYRYPNFYNIKSKKLTYGDITIRIGSDKRSIYTGNATLTDVGKQLCRFIPLEHDDDILKVCMDTWIQLGYTFKISKNVP